MSAIQRTISFHNQPSVIAAATKSRPTQAQPMALSKPRSNFKAVTTATPPSTPVLVAAPKAPIAAPSMLPSVPLQSPPPFMLPKPTTKRPCPSFGDFRSLFGNARVKVGTPSQSIAAAAAAMGPTFVFRGAESLALLSTLPIKQIAAASQPVPAKPADSASQQPMSVKPADVAPQPVAVAKLADADMKVPAELAILPLVRENAILGDQPLKQVLQNEIKAFLEDLQMWIATEPDFGATPPPQIDNAMEAIATLKPHCATFIQSRDAAEDLPIHYFDQNTLKAFAHVELIGQSKDKLCEWASRVAAWSRSKNMAMEPQRKRVKTVADAEADADVDDAKDIFLDASIIDGIKKGGRAYKVDPSHFVAAVAKLTKGFREVQELTDFVSDKYVGNNPALKREFVGGRRMSRRPEVYKPGDTKSRVTALAMGKRKRV